MTDAGAHRPRGVLPTSPPPDAVLPMRSPNAPAPGQPIPSHYRWCFGCGSEHETGLHMSITAGEGLAVSGVFTASEHHQGAPGLAHGGILTTAVDEILGSLNWLLAGPAVTGRLECDFRRPVPVGSRLRPPCWCGRLGSRARKHSEPTDVRHQWARRLTILVGVRGFEPPASTSRT